MPGWDRLLACLPVNGVPWAVVTSADRTLTTARLDHCNIVCEVVVTADDVVAGKPDPEGYLQAADRLGVDASRCLVVEDSTVGVEAGRRAGSTVAAIGDVVADIGIDTLDELIAVVCPERR
jgi:mannitol-1-/sugar-/sorbitol-6-phosphatase